jgi:cilia- and flagella-associated protein 57
VASLRRKLQKDSELHRHENIKVMQENMALISEINNLRRELKLLKQAQKEKVSPFPSPQFKIITVL